MCNLYARFEKLDSKVELTYDYVKIQVKTTYGECPPGSSTDRHAEICCTTQGASRCLFLSPEPDFGSSPRMEDSAGTCLCGCRPLC